MAKVMQQVHLVREVPGEEAKFEHLITWLDVDSRVKEETRITLRGDEREWRVCRMYPTQLPIDILDLNRGWTNNI